MFIFLFKLSKHNIYLTVKLTNKIPPFFPFFLFKSMINNIPESNKWINITYISFTCIFLPCGVSVFQIVHPIRTLIILVQDKNTSLKLPVGVSRLQLVNLHRNRKYFVIKLHTWFCLSYFLKTNIKYYCIYQYFMSINSFFNTVSVSRYSRPITVTRDPL